MAYRRLPDEVETYEQELLYDGPEVKVTLLELPPDGDPLAVGDAVTLEPGGALLWHSYPGRRFEVAGLFDPEGRLLGHYTNLVRPPRMDGRRWEITDLFLDVWTPVDGEPRVLDRDVLEEARGEGWIPEDEAERVEELAERILERAREGSWPPGEVLRRELEDVPGLRFRRDEPGRYHANVVTSRIIAFGIYWLGASSLTSVGFAAWSDALTAPGPARSAWLATLAAEAIGLLGVALAGKLPAARRVRPEEALTETTLFWGAAVSALAVLIVHDSALWRALLSAVYGTLGLFLAIFAVARLALDRKPPLLALAGLLVCLLALIVFL